MVDVKFNTYYRYDDLTRILGEFSEAYPHLVSIESIGKSYENRDIWVATVTNFASGKAEDKPALWIHGNIHAVEYSTSSACLHLLYTLTQEYDSNERVKMLLDTRVFYICPRVNPDGVEWALADKPKFRRSSTRPYPYNEDPIDGLYPEDVDGDGRILLMRIEDSNGQWKAHLDEPRLLVRREPDEYGGTYYRVLDEGFIENYDGIHMNPQREKEGLDLNRNYPNNWRTENEQPGSGEFPTSEPETRAVALFVSRHKNICLATDLHTMSGVLLRPFSSKPDSEMAAEDLWIYQKQGEKGKELTGYTDMSIFHGFKYHPNQIISGGGDWMYEHLGIFYWAIEIWNPRKQAGIEMDDFIKWWREHPIEDDLKLLKWNDEELDGKGYIDWYSFEHPQLGTIELGGWNSAYFWSNPVPHLLETEIAPFAEWFIWQGLTTPLLELFELKVTPIDDHTYHIRMVVHNTGWLPTNCTKVALQKQQVRGVIFEIELPEGTQLTTGKTRVELSQLAGRSHTPISIAYPFPVMNTVDRTFTEWVVQAPKGTQVQLTARHDRAGTIREAITLE